VSSSNRSIRIARPHPTVREWQVEATSRSLGRRAAQLLEHVDLWRATFSAITDRTAVPSPHAAPCDFSKPSLNAFVRPRTDSLRRQRTLRSWSARRGQGPQYASYRWLGASCSMTRRHSPQPDPFDHPRQGDATWTGQRASRFAYCMTRFLRRRVRQLRANRACSTSAHIARREHFRRLRRTERTHPVFRYDALRCHPSCSTPIEIGMSMRHQQRRRAR